MSMIITLFLGLINFVAQRTSDVPTTLYLFFDEEDDLMEKRVLDGIPYFYFYDEILKKKKEAASEGGELSLEDLCDYFLFVGNQNEEGVYLSEDEYSKLKVYSRVEFIQADLNLNEFEIYIVQRQDKEGYRVIRGFFDPCE